MQTLVLFVLTMAGAVLLGTRLRRKDQLVRLSPEQVRQALVDVSCVVARSALEGLRCKVVGSLRPHGELVISPFFRRPCLAYQLLAIVEFKTSDNETYTIELKEEGLAEAWVDDGSAPVFVRTDRIDLHILESRECRRGSNDDDADALSPEEHEWLLEVAERQGFATKDLRRYEAVEIRERCLLPGARVAVMGLPTRELRTPATDPKTGSNASPYRTGESNQRATLVVTLSPSRYLPVCMSDDPTTFR